MNTIRWIVFIPFGILLGVVFAIPIVFFCNIWNLDNLFVSSIVKNGFNTYFMIICMAWIVPSTCSKSGFKTLVSVLFGILIALTLMALVGPTDGEDGVRWVYAGELVGATLGFVAGIQLDDNGLWLLLDNKKGVHPYNTINQQITHYVFGVMCRYRSPDKHLPCQLWRGSSLQQNL